MQNIGNNGQTRKNKATETVKKNLKKERKEKGKKSIKAGVGGTVFSKCFVIQGSVLTIC